MRRGVRFLLGAKIVVYFYFKFSAETKSLGTAGSDNVGCFYLIRDNTDPTWLALYLVEYMITHIFPVFKLHTFRLGCVNTIPDVDTSSFNTLTYYKHDSINKSLARPDVPKPKGSQRLLLQ